MVLSVCCLLWHISAKTVLTVWVWCDCDRARDVFLTLRSHEMPWFLRLYSSHTLLPSPQLILIYPFPNHLSPVLSPTLWWPRTAQAFRHVRDLLSTTEPALLISALQSIIRTVQLVFTVTSSSPASGKSHGYSVYIISTTVEHSTLIHYHGQ
jgi:hypothetical protein